MAVNKSYKAVVKCLARNGFVFDHTNAKGFEVYVANGYEPIGVNRGIPDHAAKTLIRNIDRMCGGQSDRAGSKRKPEQIKARQAADRERAAGEVERRQREVAALLAERDERKGRAGFMGNDPEFLLFLARIEREERELRYWQSLMTEVPGFGNKNKHRS